MCLRSLVDAETRYSNIERDSVACSQMRTTEVRVLPTGTSCNHYNHHSPLEQIFEKKHCWDTIKSLEADSLVFRIRHYSGVQARHKSFCGRRIIQSLSTRKCHRRITTMWSKLCHRNRKSYQCTLHKDKTHHDSTLNMLKNTVFRGWPNLRKRFPHKLWDYGTSDVI